MKNTHELTASNFSLEMEAGIAEMNGDKKIRIVPAENPSETASRYSQNHSANRGIQP